MPEFSEFFTEKRSGPARYDIPASLVREIGQFIVTWTYFEHALQAVIWNFLNISSEEGRITVREPRATDRLDMIRELGKFHKAEMDFILLKDMRKRADLLAGYRHMMAHCFWQKFDDDWCVVMTRGVWQEYPIEIANYPLGISKNIEPQAIPVKLEEVRRWTRDTISLIDDIKKLGEQHRPEPSREKRQTRLKPQDRSHGRSRSERKRPHRSSQG